MCITQKREYIISGFFFQLKCQNKVSKIISVVIIPIAHTTPSMYGYHITAELYDCYLFSEDNTTLDVLMTLSGLHVDLGIWGRMHKTS